MISKSELRKYLSFPMFLIGSGSFFGVIGWMGLAHAAESIIFFIASVLLSLSGSMATLCGLMSLERSEPSKQKIRLLKSDISKNIKIQYPTFIVNVEKCQQQHNQLYETLRTKRSYFEVFRQQIRNFRTEIRDLDKQLQQKLKNSVPVIDNDSVDGIAKKILWSEKQIQLTEFNEVIEKLSQAFTSADLERYRDQLTYIGSGVKRLEQGVEYYRELMILCNQSDSHSDDLVRAKRRVENAENLMIRQQQRVEELSAEMNTKSEEAKIELSLFQEQLDSFKSDDAW